MAQVYSNYSVGQPVNYTSGSLGLWCYKPIDCLNILADEISDLIRNIFSGPKHLLHDPQANAISDGVGGREIYLCNKTAAKLN